MKKRSLILLTAALAAASCGGHSDEGRIGSAHGDDLVVDTYDHTFAFDAPTPCETFVETRTVDYDHFVAEFDVRSSASRLSVVYRLVPGEDLPLRSEVSASDGTPLIELWMNGDDLSVRGADGAELLRVSGYADAAPPLVPSNRAVDARVADALTALRCLLPAQPALGAVAPFMFNRRGRRTSDGVASSASDDAPIVTWSSPLTLLGSLWIAAKGLDASDQALRWQPECGASAGENALVGHATLRCALP
jgi:hypothetical protein